MIQEALELLDKADELYREAGDSQRQLLNRALFQKLYVRDNEIVSAVFNEPFDQIHLGTGRTRRDASLPRATDS